MHHRVADVNKRSSPIRRISESAERMSIDDLDRRIIREYQRNSRASLREIAAELGVSPATVMARTHRLEDAGIIKGYSILLDYEKLGYQLTAITEVEVSKGKLIEMEKEIAKLPEVCAVYDVTGETDGIVIAKFRSREDLSRFTKNLLAMPFVERTNTHLVLTTVREDFKLAP